MSDFPLPSDDRIAPEALEVLRSLPPLNVFRAVAGVPASFRPFMELAGSILGAPCLAPQERELAILRVAHVTQAAYERRQHEQLARAVGLGEAAILATTREDPATELDADGALLCRAAEEISLRVRLSDEALGAVRERWGDDGAAELILTISYFNMVSRFLESARVPLETEDLLGGGTPAEIAGRARRADSAAD